VATPFRPSTLALATLLALAVASPWAFGAVEPIAVRVVSTLALAASAAVFLLAAFRGEAALPALPLAPPLGLTGVVAAQLVPLPPVVHRILASASYAVWHPADPAAAAVLGAGWRPISLDPDATLRALAWLAGLLILAALAAPECAARRWPWRATLVVGANGLAMAAYAVWARTRFGALLYGRYEVPTTAPFGPFVSKNHFAGYVTMAALLTLGVVIALTDRRDARARGWSTGARAGPVVFAVVAAAGMALSVLVSGSRGGAVALVAGLLAFGGLTFGSARSGRRLVAPAVVGAVVAVLVLVVLPSEARQRLRTATGASFRLAVWQDSLRLAAGSPLVGVGLASFHDAFPRVKRLDGVERIEHAENEYVELLAETGALGLGLAAAAAVFLLGRGAANARAAAPIPRGLATGALSGLAALAVHNALDFNLRIPSNAALAALLAAVGASAAGLRPRSLSPRAALAGASLALVLLAAVNALPPPPSDSARRRVHEAALAAAPDALALRLERAEAGLRRALAARPAHAEAWLQLAAVRAVGGDAASASALARHAVSLDPQRPDLRAQAEALAR
jgi:O-antigen ligase